MKASNSYKYYKKYQKFQPPNDFGDFMCLIFIIFRFGVAGAKNFAGAEGAGNKLVHFLFGL